jgi:hypothetical protein
MSPTMTEGGIAGWRKKEGEAFTTGDVLLEIVRISFTIIKFCLSSESKGNLIRSTSRVSRSDVTIPRRKGTLWI